MDMPDLNFSWADEDPGTCSRCGTPHEWVRPGKTQPTCDCHNFCYAHNQPVRIEYRTGGMIRGYVCPECFKRTSRPPVNAAQREHRMAWQAPPSIEAQIIVVGIIAVIVLTPFIAIAALIVALAR